MPLETITLARIYEEQGFFEEALHIYTNILKKTPDHTEALKQIKRLEKIQKNGAPF
ncbi:tetratricopeptide repeat protein, partial [Helicobacter pylori]